MDDDAGAWHTGRVNAILPIQGSQDYAVGSDTGGVWECSPSDSFSRPLSNDWEDPDVRVLVQGPDPSLVFAGTANGSLYVSDVSGGGHGILAGFRAAATLDSSGKPVKPGTIWQGVFDTGNKRLVLACDNGLLWADLAAPGGDYIFFNATGASGPFTGVALGPGGTIIAAGRGSQPPGLFTGTWVNNQLALTSATSVTGVSVQQMSRTSLASCQGAEKFAYAVSATVVPQDSVFLAVLRTIDGGLNWTVCASATQLPNAGNQGDRNQAIAVAASAGAGSYKQLHVAMGMRRGPFISRDGGDTWVEHGDTGSATGIPSPHLHGDIQTLLFDTWDPQGRMLLVGSDGGIARTRDLGDSWETKPFNQRLPVLQFIGSNQGGRGGSSAAASVDFLIGGGTQDNQTIYSNISDPPTPWRFLDVGGDGGYLTFAEEDSNGTAAPAGLAVISDINEGRPLRKAVMNSASQLLEDKGVIPVVSGGTTNPAGLTRPANKYASLAAVRKPRWPGKTGRILEIFGTGNNLYGYRDAGTAEWIPLAALPLAITDFITSVGSLHGDPIYAGTQAGRIFAIDPDADPTKSYVLEQGVRWPTAGSPTDVKLIVAVSDAFVVAAFNNLIFRLHTLEFRPVAGIGLPQSDAVCGIAFDDTRSLLYAAFARSGVFVSDDEGNSWMPFRDGLPANPHSAELYTSRTSAGEYLFLATYGRSVYCHDI